MTRLLWVKRGKAINNIVQGNKLVYFELPKPGRPLNFVCMQ